MRTMDIEDDADDTTTTESTSSVDETPVHQNDEPGGLRRSVNHRMIGGVASGIGERFDINANVVRAIFVLLACLWGFGAAVYLVLWVLVPRSGEERTVREVNELSAKQHKRMSLWRLVLVVLGAAAVVLIFVAFYTNGPRWGSGIGTAWLILLVILAVLSFRGPARQFTLARFFSGLFLVVVSLLILVGGGFLGFLALTKVPITGGIGTNVYTPTSISQVASPYRMAFGALTVDLRHVPFRDRTVSVTASVAAGNITIEVPAGVVVDVTAHSGVQNINYLTVTNASEGREIYQYVASSGSFNSSVGKTTGHLELNVSVGVGQIQLERSVPENAAVNN